MNYVASPNAIVLIAYEAINNCFDYDKDASLSYLEQSKQSLCLEFYILLKFLLRCELDLCFCEPESLSEAFASLMLYKNDPAGLATALEQASLLFACNDCNFDILCAKLR